MDEKNKYLEDTKSLIGNKNHLKEPPNCDNLLKEIKEECVLYDPISSYLEQNRDENYGNFNDISKQKLSLLLNEISSLSSKEKLQLYFKIPGGISEIDPLRQHQNPLGTRLEINRTINWIKSHLEHDPEVSIPKQDVYNDYSVFCKNSNFKPLSTADFGKVMKQVFPDVKPRRLGTRGNSRYCYAAMRKVTKLVPPNVPVIDQSKQTNELCEEIDKDSWSTIKKWTEEVMHVSFENIRELAAHIKQNNLNPLSPSKIILQRKYMQRYNNKKKFSDINIKRKKKRKRKNSSNNEVSASISPITLKVEEFSDSNNSFNSSAMLAPMNLAMESSEFQKSNHSNIFDNSTINNVIDSNELKNSINSCESLIANHAEIDQFQTKIKENRNEDLQIDPGNIVEELLNEKHVTSIVDHNIISRSENNTLMGPPQVQSNTEFIYANNLSLRKRLMIEASMNRNFSKVSNSNNMSETENLNDDKDVILQNLGLPRERVISICNMDKHELDDYLPNIENPEEQDAELLQYFQAPEPTDTKSDQNSQIPINNKELDTNTSSMFAADSLHQSKVVSQGICSNKHNNLSKKETGFKINFSTDNVNNEKALNFLYTRDSGTALNTYAPTSLQNKNFKITTPYANSSSSRNRYNFIPISSKGNPMLNMRNSMNISNLSNDYITKLYNPTSASAPTSPNILRQKDIPCYPFENCEKYENAQIENLMNHNLKINSIESIEYRSRSVPLNGPKIEELDSNSEYISGCTSIAQTPIPQEFNDFNDQLLLNGPESLEVPVSPLNTSQQNLYIPQINNDQQNMSKKIFDNYAQKYSLNKNTISRSNPTTPLPLTSIQKKLSTKSNFDFDTTKHINKMYDLTKSMPTTPIDSEINSFRYSPDIKNNNIGVGGINYTDLKKRRNFAILNQYKDSNHSSSGIQQTNLDSNFNSFETDPANELLKNL